MLRLIYRLFLRKRTASLATDRYTFCYSPEYYQLLKDGWTVRSTQIGVACMIAPLEVNHGVDIAESQAESAPECCAPG